jgi:hypothetical protein
MTVHPENDAYQDGNTLAGPLAEIFTMDVTGAVGRCAHCGRAEPMARMHVYTRAPGWVGRCPHCGEVQIRLVRAPDAAWLDLRGTEVLRITLPS